MTPKLERQLLAVLQRIETHLSGEVRERSGVLTYQEGAQILGCKRSTIYLLVKRGEIEQAAKVGRSPMLSRESVQSYLARLRRKPISRTAEEREKAWSKIRVQ
jgi:excisionase family DNA binding protein